jgi:hypothetical protein
MPTIYHRARFLMVGTLLLCPPYDCCGLICFARKRNFMQRAATNWHDGQISQNLSSPFSRNIPLNLAPKSPA